MQPSVQFTQSVGRLTATPTARDMPPATVPELLATFPHQPDTTAGKLPPPCTGTRNATRNFRHTWHRRSRGHRRRLSTRQGWPRGLRRAGYADVLDADGLRPEAEAGSHAQARVGGSIAGIRSQPPHRRRVRTPTPSPTAALQVGRCMRSPTGRAPDCRARELLKVRRATAGEGTRPVSGPSPQSTATRTCRPANSRVQLPGRASTRCLQPSSGQRLTSACALRNDATVHCRGHRGGIIKPPRRYVELSAGDGHDACGLIFSGRLNC